MVWRENRYTEVEDNAICHQLLPWMHAAVRMVHDAQTGAWAPTDFPANPRTVRSALDSIKVLTHLPASVVSPSWLADVADMPDPREILPCRSWLLHLPTMTMFPPTPVFFSVNALDYDPNLDAPAPDNWFRFLDQLFGNDTEARELLQDWFGYCLTGDTAQHKMLLMVGPRRSGKGTIARVLAQLVGAGNVCGPTTSSLAGPFGLQPLIGKSLAIVSDARFAGENVQTVVERLLCISGEDTLTIERKHMTAVTMKLPTRFVFLTNELPRLNDASGALTSLLVAVPAVALVLRPSRAGTAICVTALYQVCLFGVTCGVLCLLSAPLPRLAIHVMIFAAVFFLTIDFPLFVVRGLGWRLHWR